MTTLIERAPFPKEREKFASDNRVSYSQIAHAHVLKDERGEEWEWIERVEKWVSVIDEALIKQYQDAFKMEGVDENEPVTVAKKRKADADNGAYGQAGKKVKPAGPSKKEHKNTAIYLTSLPDDVDINELHEIFSKFGVIAESSETSEPRIKLYVDEHGNLKGDALIVYFRPESVRLAIEMMDEADLRLGEQVATGKMRVMEADASYKSQKDNTLSTEHAKKKGTFGNKGHGKVIKKAKELSRRLADWGDDDPQNIQETIPRWQKVVVLKQMFTLAELAEDPANALDIKDEIREECEKFGKVTNIVLYDQEEAGIVTVRFQDAANAQACVKVFNGRIFDSRTVEAYVAVGKQRFKKSKKADDDVDEEKERLERFSKAIEEKEEKEEEGEEVVVKEAKEAKEEAEPEKAKEEAEEAEEAEAEENEAEEEEAKEAE